MKAGGQYTFEEIVELSTRLREARIALSTVTAWPYPEMEFSYQNFLKGVKNEKEDSPFDLQLEVLAIKSGGQVTEPSLDLAGLIERAVAGADNFYTLTFDPPRTAVMDEYHGLKIEVDRPDAVVHTNSEYYDEPVFYDQPPVREGIALAQLEEVLTNARERHDEDVVHQLNGLELTERMSSAELARWAAQMPGAKARAALVVLADESAFLLPPKDAIVQDAAPDVAAQKKMMARVVDYLAKAIPKLPDFFSTRTTVSYEEPKQRNDETWKTASGRPDIACRRGGEGDHAYPQRRRGSGCRRKESEKRAWERAFACNGGHLRSDSFHGAHRGLSTA